MKLGINNEKNLRKYTTMFLKQPTDRKELRKETWEHLEGNAET